MAPQEYRSADRWVTAAPPDPRAELLIPVNVVRIFSDEHAATQIAPDRWVATQLDIANRVFRYADADMAAYTGGRYAPLIQFEHHRTYDVHEREVSETLGCEMDTENVYGAPPDGNGPRRVGTQDLRTLMVTDEGEPGRGAPRRRGGGSAAPADDKQRGARPAPPVMGCGRGPR